MMEKIKIVDENDLPIGSATRQEAWQKGLYHEIAQIVIEDETGNILLQKRSPEKGLFPNCWTNGASGHIDVGETYETAAPRELTEELGIDVRLEYLGKVLVQVKTDDKDINQFHGVFKALVPHDIMLTPDPTEVSEVRWFTRKELQEKTLSAPEEFTPGMIKTFEEFYSQY